MVIFPADPRPDAMDATITAGAEEAPGVTTNSLDSQLLESPSHGKIPNATPVLDILH